MTARAFPPSSFHCVSGNSSGTSFILCKIPLPCNDRICSGKIIDTLFYFTICANRARASMHTSMDNGLPFITVGAAFPPNILPRLLVYIFWEKRKVSFRPFRSKGRFLCFQIIKPLQQLDPATEWTLASSRTGGYKRLPLMAFLTPPPYHSVRSRWSLVRCPWKISW